jgi:hypothetical protein
MTRTKGRLARGESVEVAKGVGAGVGVVGPQLQWWLIPKRCRRLYLLDDRVRKRDTPLRPFRLSHRLSRPGLHLQLL